LSRPLLLLALALFAVAGLAPVAVMFLRLAQDPSVIPGLLDERTLSLLGRTCLLGCGALGLALVVGVPFGFLTARTDVPGASWMGPLGLVPLIMPPLILAMTWTVLIDLRGAPMAIVLLGLGTFPIVSLFTAKAAGRIDARREEAALMAGGLRAVLRMELPLIFPAAACGACFAFVFAINDFAVPDFVSFMGPKFNVYADEIYATWQVDQQHARAVATALPLIALTFLALLPALVLRRRGSLATVDSDFQRPAPLCLGRWRWPACGFCVTLLSLGAVIPLGRLFYEAGGGHTAWGLDKLRAAFAQAISSCRDELGASILIALAVATVAAPTALVLGHAIARARTGRLLEMAVVLPIAVPAILFGIGNIALWNTEATYGFYTGGGLVVLMLVGRFLAFPTLVGAGAVSSYDPQLEEAAELAGAGPATRMLRIVAPGLLPSLVGGWVMMFVLTMRDLDTAILMPAANHTVMFRLFNAVHFGRDDFVAALALLIVFVTLVPGLLWTLLVRRKLEVSP